MIKFVIAIGCCSLSFGLAAQEVEFEIFEEEAPISTDDYEGNWSSITAVQEGDQWRLVFLDGTKSEVLYDVAKVSSRGFLVAKDGVYQHISALKEVLLEFPYDSVQFLNMGNWVFWEKGKVGALDREGNVRVEAKYDNVFAAHESGIHGVIRKGKYYYITANDKVEIEAGDEAVLRQHAVVSKRDGKYRIATNEAISDFEFDSVAVHSGMVYHASTTVKISIDQRKHFVVFKDGQSALLNLALEAVVPFGAHELENYFYDHFYIINCGDQKGFYLLKSDVLRPCMYDRVVYRYRKIEFYGNGKKGLVNPFSGEILKDIN